MAYFKKTLDLTKVLLLSFLSNTNLSSFIFWTLPLEKELSSITKEEYTGLIIDLVFKFFLYLHREYKI